MRRDAEFFENAELDLVYMAHRLRDALKLEGILTDSSIDYLVETGTYVAGILMKRDLTGAYFYVAPADTQRAKEVLLQNNYKPYRGE